MSLPVEPYSTTDLYVAFGITMAVVTASCALRFYVRWVTRGRFLLDDYLMMFAFLQFIVSDSLQIFMLKNGVLSMGTVSLATMTVNLKIIFFCGFTYIGELWAIKYSLLAFYSMVFSRPEIKYFIWFTAGYMAICLLGCYTAQLVYCSPVNSFWNPLLLEQDCHRPIMVNIVYVVTNMTSDALILFIPLWSLRQLKINNKKKLALYGLFAAGLFAIVAALMRMVMYIVQPGTISPVLLWSTVEETAGFLVANAPAVRVLFFKGRAFFTSNATSMNASAMNTSQFSRHDRTNHTGHIPDDDFEMLPKQGGIVGVVTSPRGSLPKSDLKGVLKSVEVNVHSESLKHDSESSSSD